MSKKSNEYGYVPNSPEQYDAGNTGIFEVDDVTSLLAENKWSTSSKYVELETKTIYSGDSTAFIEFDTLRESDFDNHLLVVNNMKALNGTSTPVVRVKVGGTVDTGNNYSYMESWANASSSTGWAYEGQTSATSRMVYGVSPSAQTVLGSHFSGMCLISNAGNSATSTTFSWLFSGTPRYTDEHAGYFHGVYVPAAVVNGITIGTTTANVYFYGRLTLFGIR